ncbi:MAG: HU family DNA-binding protein, partial [Candidatus Marinimicrobia bacterium]|nr:HU family DNA-binding protein [Candidatus Neomarinimicrobiota bacterium]
MNNSEILKLLAQRNGLTLKETKKLLKQMVTVFSDTLGNYVGFSIPDLGTFGTHIREARQAYDLNRQAHVLLPPKRLVSFSPAVRLKDEIKEIEVEPPAPRPAANAPQEAAPGTEAPLEVQEAEPEDSHESLRRELQAEREEETAEQTAGDVPPTADKVTSGEAAQP